MGGFRPYVYVICHLFTLSRCREGLGLMYMGGFRPYVYVICHLFTLSRCREGLGFFDVTS